MKNKNKKLVYNLKTKKICILISMFIFIVLSVSALFCSPLIVGITGLLALVLTFVFVKKQSIEEKEALQFLKMGDGNEEN